ncbi:MAG: phosphoribosylglycinamide formyltransferase [Porticoccaceae bacterium]|nr:phosphoribosylglycinamide formyltransferase [Porticoccaceae bacterium]
MIPDTTNARAKTKIVVLISGSGSNLQAFIDARDNRQLNADLVGVISNRPKATGLKRAARAGIASRIIDHQAYPKRLDFDRALAAAVADYNPDLVILAGFMRILSAEFVDRFSGRMLNIHPSLLPKYPGLNTHQRALDAGDNEAGTTVHFVTSQLDGGPPIVQGAVPIISGDSAADIAARVLGVEHVIFPMAVQWYCEGRLSMQDGATLLDGEVLAPTGRTFEA